MPTASAVAAALFACALAQVLARAGRAEAHGAVTHPRPRNAIDGGVAPWNGTVPAADKMPFMFYCAHPDSSVDDPRNLTGSNGQACFFFNNGCDISCDECDGSTGQVVQPHFEWGGVGPIPPFAGAGFRATNTNHSIRPPRRDGSTSRLSICAEPKRRATICDPTHRTLNVDAPCRSPTDFYQYSPWRAPGAAPMIDSCGVAGGVYQWQPAAAAGGDYQPTPNARRGDLGSKLPRLAKGTGTVWTAGSEVTVAWTLKAWHGGGYQYRLCPAGDALDEDCFQRHPVPFASRRSALRWGGAGGDARVCSGQPGGYVNCHVPFNATDVSVGTLPAGSAWRKGAIAAAPWSHPQTGSRFEPPCTESAACRGAANGHAAANTGDEGSVPCECSGWGDGDMYRMEQVDTLKLPADLAAGEWVLGQCPRPPLAVRARSLPHVACGAHAFRPPPLSLGMLPGPPSRSSPPPGAGAGEAAGG